MTLTIESVSATRLQLWESGYRPVPVVNGDASGPSPGKRPLGDNWRQAALKDPPFCVSSPAVPFALNTGILADGLRAIDIDVDDPQMARRIQAMAVDRFGETCIRMRRNSPRSLILYRAATGTPPKVVIAGTDRQKVEILGAGQQFVAFGRHDSGADLEWFPEPPGEVTASQLPSVTEDDILAFLEAVAPLIGARPPGKHTQDHFAATEAQADPLRIAAAIAAIPNAGPADWEAWNRMGMAIWGATGGSAIGGELFNEWSKRHPAYDPAETEARWLHYRSSPPTSIGAGTLFHLAGSSFRPEIPLEDAPPPIEDPGYYAGLHDPQMSAEDWAELEARETGHAIPSSPEVRKQAGDDVIWTIAEPWNEADIPVRPWLARGYLMRRSVTVVSGPGSAGKSSLMVAWACALGIGSSFSRMKIGERLKVVTYNVEDDADEQKRRFSATLRKMGLTSDAIRDHLLILGPSRVGTLLHTGRDGTLLLNTPVLDRIEALLTVFQPNVLMLDPFVELHQSEENDNTAIRAVMARFRAMAIQHDMSVVILHHARKGGGNAAPGDPDSLRGASSIVGAARVALTLNVMSEDEAKTFGISNEKRHNYFRLDRAKSNYAPIEEAEWFERHEIKLENGGDGEDPDGVAVVWPWRTPSMFAQQQPADINRALDLIDQGPEPGVLYTASRQGGGARWAGKVLIGTLGVNDTQAAAMIGTWIKTGLLYDTTYQHPTWRRTISGVRVDISKRPS
jgi:AAA domain/Primase C terminal 2 (PriCT-2)/Bifunctional DNA primase/polymerase, N-terminal